MTSPEEILEDWEEQINREKDKGMLRAILQDLNMELNDAESWVSRYESLIEEVKEKLGDLAK